MRVAGAEHACRERPRLLISGLDSLYVGYFLDMATGALDWDELAYRKERIGQSRKDAFSEVTLGSETFALRPFGRHPYRYILTNRAFTIGLGEHIQPGCYVQFSSEALWSIGLDRLVVRFDDWRRSMRFQPIRREKVSRADWAFDYDYPEIEFRVEQFVSRATKDNIWRENTVLQSFQFGKGDVVVRVYDKAAEIEQKSGKAWFHPLWGRKAGVLRIEFQVRGDRLHAAGIDTLEDLKHFQGDLLRELAQGHTTLRRPGADHNRSRWPLHRLWRALRDDIAALPQSGLIRHIDPRMPLDWRLHKQLQALYGSLKGIAAVLALREGKTDAPTFDAVLGALPALLASHHDAHAWAPDVERRITGYGLGRW